MVTSRDRVIAALNFINPDRPPRDIWPLPYISLFQQREFDLIVKKFPMDLLRAQLYKGWREDMIQTTARIGAYRDDWGSIWHVAEPGVIGEVTQPALNDWSKLKHFKPPWNLIHNQDMTYVNQTCDESDLFVYSDIAARPFERLQFLRGTMNIYLDLGYGDLRLIKLLEIVHEYYMEDIKRWCESNVDAIYIMDDWGSGRQLLINPITWRELFKPLYKDYCDLIHSSSKFAFFHSDGNIESIFGDLLEVGFDAINSQLFVMDIENLARKYKGRVTFWGEIDRQHVLPFGTPEDVHDAVMRVRKSLDDESGGVIAQCEWGKCNPKENIEMVFSTWNKPMTS